MTARSLHNLPARNMLRVVRQNRKMAIVTSILMIISGPLIIGPLMWELIRSSLKQTDEHYSYLPSLEMYIAIGAFCLCAAVFMGMFCAIASFTETHKKAQVDMLYSLPLTGTQRFFSDYLGGACMYIFPYLITVILGWIIIGVGCPFIRVAPDETLWSMVGEIVQSYAMMSTGLLFLMLLYYTLGTLITVCCGTLFESIYTNILLNCLIPGTVAAVLGMVSEHVDLSFEYLWHIIGFMSPIGGLFYLYYLTDESVGISGYYYSSWNTIRGTETHTHEVMPNYFRWLFIIAVLTALLLVAAWQLYKRRKAEQVGQPFVYIAAYHVMITLLIVLILCLLDFNVIGPVLLFAAIVYFVSEVIRKRGFKRFWLSIITFVVTVAATVGVFALTIKTNCFGRENYVPLAGTVRSVEVDYRGGAYEADLEFTDREVISQVVDFHKSVVQRKKTDSDPCIPINRALTGAFPYRVDYSYNYNAEDTFYINPMDPIEPDYDYGRNTKSDSEPKYGDYAQSFRCEFTYYTITGTVVHREVSINADELLDLRLILLDSKLFKQSAAEGLKNIVKNDVGVYDNKTNMHTVPDTFRLTIFRMMGEQTRAISGGEAAIQQLSDAYLHDMERLSARERMTAPIYCTLGSVNSTAYKIYEGYDETIALLENWGFDRGSVAERYDYVDAENPRNGEAGNRELLSIRIYKPEQWTTDSLKYPNSSVSYSNNTYVKGNMSGVHYAYADHIWLTQYHSIQEYYPELYKLLEAAQPEYISEEPCYCILVNDNRYILPPKYNDLAEAVIAKGDFYSQEAMQKYYEKQDAAGGGYVVTTPDKNYDEEEYEEYEEETLNSDVISGYISHEPV